MKFLRKFFYTGDDAKREQRVIAAMLHLKNNPHFEVFLNDYLIAKAEGFRRTGRDNLGEVRQIQFNKSDAVEEILEDVVENYFQRKLSDEDE